MTALTVYPTLQLLVTAVFDTSDGLRFAGAERLADATRDPLVVPAIRNTVVFAIVVVAVETFLGLALALAATALRRGSGVYRTLLLLPLLLPGVAIGTMWRLMFDYSAGAINQVLLALGIAGPTWLADPGLALPSVMAVEVWHSTSFLFIIFLAALANMPREVLEAAEIDGAGRLQSIRWIVLPLLRPVLLIAVILRAIDAFKIFDVLVVLTGGGPGTATEMLNLRVFDLYFQEFRYGYAAFLAVILAAIIGLFVASYAGISRRVQAGADR
ncbi:MAG: carbohydrate ABC transporter permease [Candidatus Limnocylindrales bacterium]